MTTAAHWQRYLTHGDEDSFAALFDAEKDVVWTICVRYLGHGEDAEEAFQSAWARLVTESRAAQFTADAAQDHLCRTAGREADALRKRRARRNARETTMPTPPDSIDTGRSPVASLDEAERRAAVEALVAQLPEKLRLPVQLHYLNGMSQRQVAATLGVPRTTIDSRLRVALEKLRPLAERAGLRDALPVLAGGGMSAGLLATPASLTAASVLAGAATSTTVAGGVLSGTAAKIAAACAAVALVAGVGIGLMRTPTPETAARDAASSVQIADAEIAYEQALTMVSAPEPDPAEPEVSDADTASVEPALRVTEAEAVEAVIEPEETELAEAAAPVAEAEEEPETPEDSGTRFLSILVVDALDDALIPNADVRVRSLRYNRTSTTNTEGVARFDDVPLGNAIISASAEGYAEGTLRLDVASTDPVVMVKLNPGSILYGVVQDEKGTPIPDVEIIVSNTQDSFLYGNSDAEGRYEVSNVARGVPLSQVYVSHPGYKRNAIQEVIIPETSERFEHDIILETLMGLSGIVIEANTGRPIANARLRGSQQMREEPIGSTDRSGHFEIENFTVVNNQILFVADGYARKAVDIDTAVEGWLEVELDRGLVASGVVVSEAGNPVENVRISFATESYHFIASASTGEDGAFYFEDLAVGVICWVTPPRHSSGIRHMGLEGKTNQRIVVPRYSPVTGRVVDASSGEPVEQFRVRLNWATTMQRGDEWPRGITTTDIEPGVHFDTADGVFRMGNFPPRTALSVIVDAEGYAPTEIGRVVVDPEAEPVTIQLNRLTAEPETP